MITAFPESPLKSINHKRFKWQTTLTPWFSSSPKLLELFFLFLALDFGKSSPAHLRHLCRHCQPPEKLDPRFLGTLAEVDGKYRHHSILLPSKTGARMLKSTQRTKSPPALTLWVSSSQRGLHCLSHIGLNNPIFHTCLRFFFSFCLKALVKTHSDAHTCSPTQGNITSQVLMGNLTRITRK